MTAGALMAKLNLEQANASQHLAVLRAKQVVVNRRAGNQVYYSLRDPVLLEVLDLLRRYFQAHLNETASMLGEMDEAARPRRPRKPARRPAAQMSPGVSRIPWHRWRPALLDCLRGYDRRRLATDVIAGITVGLVALPLAMAFGIA